MPVSVFRTSFFMITVTYYSEGWQTSYYEAIQKSDAIYSFTVNKSQPLFVSLDFYP